MHWFWILFLVFVFLIFILCVVALGKQSNWLAGKKRDRYKGRCKGRCYRSSRLEEENVYGEFIRPFTFGDTGLHLAIVQPGGSLVFPVATVPPVGVAYVDNVEQGTGLLVPQGVYVMKWKLNPSSGAIVNLLVNGQSPQSITTPPINYAQSITTTELDAEYFVQAPLPQNNLISIINAGQTLFSLDNIQNTTVGETSIITQIQLQRLGPIS